LVDRRRSGYGIHPASIAFVLQIDPVLRGLSGDRDNQTKAAALVSLFLIGDDVGRAQMLRVFERCGDSAAELWSLLHELYRFGREAALLPQASRARVRPKRRLWFRTRARCRPPLRAESALILARDHAQKAPVPPTLGKKKGGANGSRSWPGNQPARRSRRTPGRAHQTSPEDPSRQSRRRHRWRPANRYRCRLDTLRRKG
jgi:hypothetical protein